MPAHVSPFLRGTGEEALHGFQQPFPVLYRAEIAADAILHRFPAAGDIRRNQRTACRRPLQQYIGHAFMVRREYDTVGLRIKRPGVLLETVEDRNAVPLQCRYLVFIGVFKKSDQIQAYLLPVRFIQRPDGVKQLIDSLLLHDPPQIQKSHLLPLRIRTAGVVLQIDSSSM